MKKSLIVGISAVVAILAAVMTIVFWPRTFALSEEYQGGSGFIEIDEAGLQSLIDDKKSFVLFVYQSGCITSEDFERNLVSFSEKEQVKFVKIKFSEAKSSGLVGELRYYPSVALYHDGELAIFLRTDRNDDMPAYDSESGFAQWWHQYVK